jgi:hypothetical protein
MSAGEHSTPGTGMVLTVAISFNSPALAQELELRTTLVPRGTVVPVHLLAGMLNASSLLSAGVLRWQPPAVAARRIAPPPPAAPRPAPAPRDWIAELRARLSLVMEQRGVNQAVAEDIIIGTPEGADLYRRAQAQFAEMPRLVQQNGYTTRTGRGSHGSRSIQGFRELLREKGP